MRRKSAARPGDGLGKPHRLDSVGCPHAVHRLTTAWTVASEPGTPLKVYVRLRGPRICDGMMSVMSKSPGGGRRHLSGVPGSGEPGPRRDREPGLFEVAIEPDKAPAEFDVPPGVTTAHVLTHLTESGAPPEILEYAAGFGDDIQALLHWLDESATSESGRDVTAGLLTQWQPLLERGVGALDAELFGLEFLSMFGEVAKGSDAVGALTTLIAEAAGIGGPEALAMARVFAHVGPAEIRSIAATAANRLATAGVKDRPWVRSLGSATWVSAHGYIDPNATMETLSLEFRFGTKTHSCVVLIDHTLGGGVKDCWIAPDARSLLVQLRLGAIAQRIELLTYARAEAEALLSAALAAPPCPVTPDQVEDVRTFLPLLRMRAALVLGVAVPDLAVSAVSLPAVSPARLQPVATATPGRTTHSAKPKPVRRALIHRIKVTLTATKPPIWRRLEVPSNTSLSDLSELLQAAFDWAGGHLWLYETPKGEYGEPDAELNLRNARRLTLGAAAPVIGSKITYVYDFGDDWRHVIAVEAIAPADGQGPYPRCTAGRRAAPPEDCGGPWGYENLLAILADPANQEHASMLEWLGLESADEFDPAEFDADELSEILQHY